MDYDRKLDTSFIYRVLQVMPGIACYKYFINRYNPNKCFWNAYNAVLDAGNTAMNKIVFVLLWYFHFKKEQKMMNNKQVDELTKNCHEHKREWCDGDSRAPWTEYIGKASWRW